MAYALGLAGTFWRPQVGIYFYAAIYFLNPLERWWGSSIPELRYGFMIALATLISFVLHGYLARLKTVLSRLGSQDDELPAALAEALGPQGAARRSGKNLNETFSINEIGRASCRERV